jgi:hypothetical protein
MFALWSCDLESIQKKIASRLALVMMATIDMQKKYSRSPCVWGKSHCKA